MKQPFSLILVILILIISCNKSQKGKVEIKLTEIGVFLKRGTDNYQIYKPGTYSFNRNDRITVYSITETSYIDSLKSSDYNLEFKYVYKLNIDNILELHKEYGDKYFETLVKIQIRGIIYNVFRNLNSTEIDTSNFRHLLEVELEKKEYYNSLIKTLQIDITNIETNYIENENVFWREDDTDISEYLILHKVLHTNKIDIAELLIVDSVIIVDEKTFIDINTGQEYQLESRNSLNDLKYKLKDSIICFNYRNKQKVINIFNNKTLVTFSRYSSGVYPTGHNIVKNNIFWGLQNDTTFVAINIANDSILWSKVFDGNTRYIYSYETGNVLFLFNRYLFLSLNKLTGETLWQYDSDKSMYRDLIFHDNYLYYSNYEIEIRKLNLVTGIDSLYYSSDREQGYIKEFEFSDGVLYFILNGDIFAMQLDSKKLLWEAKVSGAMSLRILGNYILFDHVEGDSGELLAINKFTGKFKFSGSWAGYKSEYFYTGTEKYIDYKGIVITHARDTLGGSKIGIFKYNKNYR